jgi:hypothetical protein
MPLLATKKVEIVNNNFGRIKELIIFALPNKKGAKKAVLRVVKKGETERV